MLITKDSNSQYGFGITLVVVEALILGIIFVWMIYRFILVIMETTCFKQLANKVTQNTSP